MLQVGRIGRPHGLRGEVLVNLTTDRLERLEPGSQLQAGDDAVVVVEASPHSGRWRVRFEGITDREGAEHLVGRELFGEPLEDPDALWAHDVIGTMVAEPDGTERGRVVAVLENPASDLLELDSGALVPVRFVVASEGGVTTVEAPDGLFDER